MTNANSKHAAHFDHYDESPTAQYKHCWADAFYNLMTNAIHAPKPGFSIHRLAAGTLSSHLGIIYGSATNNPEDFVRRPDQAHCWIEDGDGRIWDYIHPQLTRKGIKVPHNGFHIMGLTPAEIKRRFNLCYTRTANNAIRRIYDYAFQDFLPLCLRTDNETLAGRDVDLGYHDFTLAAPDLDLISGNLLRRTIFDRWRTVEMKFNQLLNGNEETLLRWRDFYAQPLDRSRFSPVVTLYGIKKTIRMTLDDDYEADLYINEGIAIGELNKVKNNVRTALDLYDQRQNI